MKMRRKTICISLLTMVSISLNVTAHTTIAGKNTPDKYNVREDPDGASTINHINLPHGCGDEKVRAVSILFPNGEHPVIVDKDGALVEDIEMLFNELEPDNNLVMGAQPAYGGPFKEIKVRKGTVRPYNNHGPKTEDVRAFTFNKGKLPHDVLGLFAWRAKFAAIKSDSCLKKIRLQMPIVNYCLKSKNSPDRVDAWIGRLTPLYDDLGVVSAKDPEDDASEAFWPYLDIINTDFDEVACAGQELEYSVSPSDESIDEFLPMKGYWPIK